MKLKEIQKELNKSNRKDLKEIIGYIGDLLNERELDWKEN